MLFLEKCNPITAAVYFLLTLSVTMFCMNPVLLCISFVGALIQYFCLQGGRNGSFHAAAGSLFLVTFLLNPLFSHQGKTVLFVVNDRPITLEALLYGAAFAGMLTALLYWFCVFTGIMSSDKLLYLFGKLSPKLALVLTMGLRYVPLFTEQWRKIQRTQTALGLYKEENIVDRFRGGVRVFSILLTWALEYGIITADSMMARGYGTGKRSHFSIFHFHLADGGFLFTSVVLFAVTIWQLGCGNMDFSYYPTVGSLSFSPAAAAGYISYGALVLLPVMIGVEEKIKWNRLRSGI